MVIKTIKLDLLKEAPYNPRVDLAQDDPDYIKVKRSLETFDLVEPVVWNKRTGHIVGGHQRVKALRELGRTEVEVSVVDLPLDEEKKLNVRINKVKGRWDYEKLADLIASLPEEDVELTGFEDWEIDSLNVGYDHIDDLLENNFSDVAEREHKEKTTFVITFSLPEDARDEVEAFLAADELAREKLVEVVVRKAKGVDA